MITYDEFKKLIINQFNEYDNKYEYIVIDWYDALTKNPEILNDFDIETIIDECIESMM